MLKRLTIVAATIAMTFAGATAVANADETGTPRAAAAGLCGKSETMPSESSNDRKESTCRWISGYGRLTNTAHNIDVAQGDIRHRVIFNNQRGRDMHLGFYRQGVRNGKWYTHTWRYNALVPRNRVRAFESVYSGHYYSRIRGVVKHHSTGRAIYTPVIHLK